jgi:hypothetical protein
MTRSLSLASLITAVSPSQFGDQLLQHRRVRIQADQPAGPVQPGAHRLPGSRGDSLI